MYNLTGNISVNAVLILPKNTSKSLKSSLYNQVSSVELLQEIYGNTRVHKTVHMHVIVKPYGPTDRYMLNDLSYACWKWIPFQATMGTHMWKCFFTRKGTLCSPVCNINSLICKKCFAGLPCPSPFTPEVSCLETNVISTRR